MQLKQLAGDTLIISIIPADTGKPTTRLEKAKVKDGNCYWEKPHCETVKFVQDPKNGKFHEKIYHFSLATVYILSNSSLQNPKLSNLKTRLIFFFILFVGLFKIQWNW